MNVNDVTDVTVKAQAPQGATAEQVLQAATQLQTLTGLYFFVRASAEKAEQGGIVIHCKMLNKAGFQLAINSNLIGAAITEEFNNLRESLTAQGINTDSLFLNLEKQYEQYTTAV